MTCLVTLYTENSRQHVLLWILGQTMTTVDRTIDNMTKTLPVKKDSWCDIQPPTSIICVHRSLYLFIQILVYTPDIASGVCHQLLFPVWLPGHCLTLIVTLDKKAFTRARYSAKLPCGFDHKHKKAYCLACSTGQLGYKPSIWCVNVIGVEVEEMFIFRIIVYCVTFNSHIVCLFS